VGTYSFGFLVFFNISIIPFIDETAFGGADNMSFQRWTLERTLS
jgi:hypothetical protein